MPHMHASFPGLLVEYLLLVGDVEAVDVLEIHVLALDYHLRELKVVELDHPQQPFLVFVFLAH